MIPVNVDNFVRAETARILDDTLAMTGGVNRWVHLRVPTPLDSQPVIRQNRDTLYSAVVVDMAAGAELTLPDAGGRYMTVMVINEDHYLNQVLSGPGTYTLDQDRYDTRFANLSIRTFVDPNSTEDIAVANTLQDAVVLEAGSKGPYTHPDYDPETLDATREALLKLSEGLSDLTGMFGRKEEVAPVRHLLGTASAWGGLPEHEAFYYFETEPRPAGHYTLTLGSVPVDAFWSVTIYNKDGYLESNPYDSYSLNSVTAEMGPQGTFTLNLSPEGTGLINHLYVMEGWNYVLRLYKPRAEVIDKTWTPPTPKRID